jgi:phosphoglycolate phosphatase-like HAD superfamily hydrolase
VTARRLILFDLDDTLSDRAGAFRNWARKWIARHGIGDPDALDWMCTNDDGGYRPRDLFFADAKERFALPQRASELARDYALTAHERSTV